MKPKPRPSDAPPSASSFDQSVSREVVAGSKMLRLCSALVVLAAAASVRGNSEVMDSISTFRCCSPVLRFDPRCDSIWSFHGTNVASSISGELTACVSPCEKLEGGEMTLDACVDLNVTTVCTEMGVIVEKRVQYQSQPCPKARADAAGPRAHGAALLLLVIAGTLATETLR